MKLWTRIVTALVSLLFATAATASNYTGFKELKKGEWAILVMKMGKGSKMKEKLIYLGEAKIDGKPAYGVEIIIDNPQMRGFGGVSQIWMDKKSDEEIKMVMQQGPQLMCMSMNMAGMMQQQEKPMTKTPEAYSPEKPALRFGTYTTPTGKKVHVAVYKSQKGDLPDANAEGEIWVSSETPFGIVKMVSNGKTVMYLEDFGKGAKPRIPVSKAIQCQPMDFGQMMGGMGVR
ncbi:hypothetical protein [Hydrogenimonas urashimensis]|uniref:hypothetical protein n=1 Tax=Hydrogenimonas urashimensis TaxID=2740515 RepID=UPI00191652D1|nr:hypothetical protein [Hydrogenimonas urashimensis]